METIAGLPGRLDPWYVTGFVEGEGCFTFSRGRGAVALYFAIKLTAADREVLDEIQRFFRGIGRIYRVKPRRAPTPGSGLTKEAAYYRVTRKADLEIILRHFEQFPLRGKKADSFEIWRRMVMLKRGPRTSLRQELEELAQELSSASPRNQAWTA